MTTVQSVPKLIHERLERATRLSITVMSTAVLGLGVMTGAFTAAAWQPSFHELELLFVRIQFVAFLIGLLLALPGLLLAPQLALQGNARMAWRGAVGFAGALAVFVGNEFWSHSALLLPCQNLVWLCEGGSIASRWHQLHHALVMGVPLLLLWWTVMRRSAATSGN